MAELIKHDASPAAPIEMRQLDWFIGEWVIQSSYRTKAEPETWVDERAISTVTPILGGHALLETFKGTLDGKAFEGMSVRTYNPAIQKWEQRWKDTMQGEFAEFTGEYHDPECTFIAYSNRSFTDAARTVLAEKAVREIFFDIEKDRFSWRLEGTHDSGKEWTVLWRLEYSRPNT